MLDHVKAKEAVKSGLAAVCAWCEHYWEATDQRPSNHSGCIIKKCGGPSVHMAFPEYKGPWNPKEKYCFLCGKSADAIVDISGKGAIGVCDDHVSRLKEILSSNGKAVVIQDKQVLAL